MAESDRTPRGWVHRTLQLFGGRIAGGEVAASILEEYERHQRTSRGALGARLWIVGQVVSSVPPLVIRRMERGLGRVRPTLADLRYSARRLLASPLHTSLSVGTLALCIGATTALYSVLSGVVLAPLPYAEPDRLHRAWAHSTDGEITDFSFRVAEYQQLHDEGVAASYAVEFPEMFTVETPEGAERVVGRKIGGGYFELFGVVPAHGTTFLESEIRGGDAHLVLLSWDFWQRTFGGDASVVGRSIVVNGQPHEVRGVLPSSFIHPGRPDTGIYAPYTNGTSGWIGRWLELYLRVPPDRSPSVVQDEIEATMAAIGEAGDTRSQGWTVTVEPLDEMVLGGVRRTVWILFASVAALLLIAAANVAGLAVARSLTRLDELKVRRALGATRGRISRLLMAENAVLAIVGGAAGLVVGWIGLRVLLHLAPPGVPRLDDVSLDAGVLVFSLVATAGAGVLFGVAPAWLAARDAAAPRSTRHVAHGSGLLGVVVVTEVALTLSLVAGAGLLSRTVRNLGSLDLGFDHTTTMYYRVGLPADRYGTLESIEAYVATTRESLGALPGVVSVGMATQLPVGGQGPTATPLADAWLLEGREDGVGALQLRADPVLHDALGIEIVEGRGFLPTDRPDTELVTVLSESLAARLFSGESAVGRRIGFAFRPEQESWMRVVGVARDAHYLQPDAGGHPHYYEPFAQSPARDLAFVVRSDAPVTSVRSDVMQRARAIDPSAPVYNASTLRERVRLASARQAFSMRLFGLFTAIAAALTVVGIYGVLAFSVARRSRELGIRVALGAPAADLAVAVTRRTGVLVGVGVVLGIVGALAVRRGMEGILFGIEGAALDIVIVAILATLAAAAASALLPLRRALRVDPIRSLGEP